MDLEVVGRHALLFDDDAMSAFVNSSEALVEWNSLSIDRYDVRHLLPSPLPPRLKRRAGHHPGAPSSSLEADLDYERYLDLPSPSEEQEQDNDSELVISDGYHAVGFSYGNPNKAIEAKNNCTDSGFHPHFPVPESLLSNLPPNEKVHQIIARTAMFVSKHGGQSEIILRVKQGDNPTFGFLMPDHHLHAYFRFLVDHQELLKPGIDGGNSSGDKNDNHGLDQTGGALSLLGSVYGSGDDDDGTPGKNPELKRNECEEAIVSDVKTSSQGTEQAESSPDGAKKDGITSKDSICTSKEKVPVIKRNHSISSVKAAASAKAKNLDALGSLSNAGDKSLTSLPSKTKIERPIVEPPSDLKRVIEKIAEFVLKNGRKFESVLAEQDRAYGRFPFLLPSNQYHPYYIKVLQNAQESKSLVKGFLLEKHDPVGRPGDKRSASHKESDKLAAGSMGSDLPYDNERKEKFKMIIGKSKKDGQEATSRDSQPQMGVSMDAAAAAAILQAATRGIKNPSLEILSKSSSCNYQGLGSDGGYLSGAGSLLSSQPQISVQKSKQNAEASVSVPVAKVIGETAAIVAAGEADSSEASMSKEQKLKAERLKRAKMFAAMIKSGSAQLNVRGISAEPPGSGISGPGAETGNLVGKEREGSSVPHEVDNSDKSLKSEEKLVAGDTERRSKRKYRSSSSRHEEEEDRENKKDLKRSRRKHRSHRSSHGSWDRHKHKKRHSSSKDRDHSSSSDDESHHSRDYHEYDNSSDGKRHSSRRQRRKCNSSEDEHQHSRHRHRSYSSSDDGHRHRRRTRKHRSRSQADRGRDLEEGEINMKPDQSRASEDRGAGREASVDLSKSYRYSREPSQPSETTDVSDELRAKIRAMLMATL